MPTDACQFFYECSNCKTLLRPKPGDCCVFCSYGSVKCPPLAWHEVPSPPLRRGAGLARLGNSYLMARMRLALWLEVAVASPSDVVDVVQVILQNARDAAFRDENQILVEYFCPELPACREFQSAFERCKVIVGVLGTYCLSEGLRDPGISLRVIKKVCRLAFVESELRLALDSGGRVGLPFCTLGHVHDRAPRGLDAAKIPHNADACLNPI
jgi:hypothetical protein